ncbi:Alk-exo [Artaxa digramma nucleopolyhedrovirus]|uniref:Alk-exo n=1 Tax=Artaxa digramma nucleopolyhedrovirus TaxID=3070910 RepID=A0AAE6R6I8_9ABAC|nr:Alk-exo [Euproctis digramma nucleopolyhedrovirus]QHB21778.1 Alk-exo [Artaxa digramma nucleopolyhedrovirus]
MSRQLLSDEQRVLCEKFMYTNYVSSLQRIDQHLSNDEITYVEIMTRGQSKNALWNLLRLDRLTASGCANNNVVVSRTKGMVYGIETEKTVKRDKILMRLIKEFVERRLNSKVVQSVTECGMFFTKLGLNSASPDAYMLVDSGALVPVEIKCPISYRDTSVDEMRNSLNVRKDRYRVKHTAFSVNKIGPAVFMVERTDPHYRQMQRQMYVLDAPICVYVVKFKNSYVASVVERDETFCERERHNEQKLFNMFVSRNRNKLKMSTKLARKNTFDNQNHALCNERIEEITAAGMYYAFGKLRCYFCNNEYSLDSATTRNPKEHRLCEISRQTFVVIHPQFFDHAARVDSFRFAPVSDHVDPKYAEFGVFYCKNNKNFLTFCCDQIVARENLQFQNNNNGIQHRPDCSYHKLLKENC